MKPTLGLQTIVSLVRLLPAALFLGGCVIVPYPVSPEVETIEAVRLNTNVLVSVGPDRLLKKIESRLEDREAGIEIADALAFRDAAYPAGEWKLARLLEEGVAPSVAASLGVDYLVLVSVSALEASSDEKGLMLYPLMAMSVKETSAFEIAIIDLRRGVVARTARIEASGHTRGGFWVLYGVFTDPMTERAVLHGVQDAVMATLRERQNTGTVRVTVLATEAGVLYVPNDTSGQLAAPAASEAGWMMRDDEVWDWNPASNPALNDGVVE